jgi:hypothetical protein
MSDTQGAPAAGQGECQALGTGHVGAVLHHQGWSRVSAPEPPPRKNQFR